MYIHIYTHIEAEAIGMGEILELFNERSRVRRIRS